MMLAISLYRHLLCHIRWSRRKHQQKDEMTEELYPLSTSDYPTVYAASTDTWHTLRMYQWDIARPCRSPVINKPTAACVREGAYASTGKKQERAPVLPHPIHIPI